MLGIPGAILDGFAADDYTLPGRGVLMQQAKACPIQCVEFQGFNDSWDSFREDS